MRAAGLLLGASLLAGCGGSSAPPPAPSTPSLPPLRDLTAAVLEHHGNARRDGVYVDPGMTRAAAARVRPDPSFQASVDGAIYAQPLYVPGGGGAPDLVVVATEANVVAAFDARTGAAVWARALGPPVSLSALPCGNIDPLGVTGTPVVDAPSRTVYLDAMTSPDGGATKQHLVFALSLDDGRDRAGWPVDVAAALAARGRRFDPAVQNQRGALALAAGEVYVPYGGHNGDCGDFRGWLVAIPADRPSDSSAWSSAARGGGSWAPGGVASDAGQVFISTGNTFEASAWSGGEAILRFVAGVPLGDPADLFAPSNWRELDHGDVDIGGSGPVLVDVAGATPSRLAVGLGKDGKIYVLDRERLGGIGGAVAVAPVAEDPIITAAAAYTTASGTYVVFTGSSAACPGGRGAGLVAVRLVPGAPPRPAVAWCAPFVGRGSPSVTTTDGSAEAVVWVAGAEGDGALHAFDGDTGAPLLDGIPIDGEVRRFQAPIALGGRVYVAVDGGVRAFTR